MIIVACKDAIDYDRVETVNYGPFASYGEATEWVENICNHVFAQVVDTTKINPPTNPTEDKDQLRFPW